MTPEAVWVINPDQSISRIDPRTNRVVARVKARAQVIAAGEGDVWIRQEGGIAEVDTARNVVSRQIALGEDTPSGLAVGAGSVWAADPFDGAIWRIPRDRPGKRRISLARWVNVVAFGAGSVWATNEITDEVYRVDPRTNAARVVAHTASPRGVGAGDGGAWVVAASPPSRDAALPLPACSAVVSGVDDPPRFLLVSGPSTPGRVPSRHTGDRGRRAPRPAAARLRGGRLHRRLSVLRFLDGAVRRLRLFRCGSLAKAYARNLRVVGIVGSFTSPYSYVQIPVTNRAAEGPLAMLSPSNTLQDLTEDEELYPIGLRNYVRIAGDDHLQAVAHAELAKQLSARRVAVLSPQRESPYPRFARDVRTAGRRLGVDVVPLRYDPRRRTSARSPDRSQRSVPTP